MRTILYIVVFKFFLVGMVLGQDKPIISNLTISECIDLCPTKGMIETKHIKDNKLQLGFGIHLNCCFGDTFLVEKISDTLKFVSESKHNLSEMDKKRKSSGDFVPSFKPYCTCSCYFDVFIEVKNVSVLPKFIVVDEFIYDSIDGFLTKRNYQISNMKKRENNSNLVTYLDLKSLIGKKIDSKPALLLYGKLGTDSFSYKNSFSINYFYDCLYIVVNTDRVVESIQIKDGFKGKLNGNITTGMKLGEVQALLGKSRKRKEAQLFHKWEDGENTVEKTQVFFYRKEKLVLAFDSKNELYSIQFRNEF